jgi:hypothetical protein
VIPVLVANGEAEAAREILRAWYRLANVVEADYPMRRSGRWISRVAILMYYRDYFPALLNRKLDAAADNAHGLSLSQVETALLAAIDRRSQPVTASEIRRVAHDVLAEDEYITRQQFRSHLRQAFLLWLGLPWRQRWKYFSRAIFWITRQDVRTTASQIVRWRQTAAWQSRREGN